MRVRVRLFAGIREAVGASSVELDLPAGADLAAAFDRLCAGHPRAAAYRAHAILAVNGHPAPPGTPLRDGAEIAILPPVSGGALQEGPVSLDALVAELERAGAGAVVGFLGLVRPDGGTTRLRFEAYPEMAEREIAAIRQEAIAKFGLTDCRIAHRIATLPVGEPIVAVATAAAHRGAAFEAAAWIMDELKSRVAIWKAEERADGHRWINDPTG